MAEIISEIQQYQNQPYCLRPCPKLRAYLESLDPFPEQNEKEICEYLWNKSIELEPRDASIKKKVRIQYMSVKWF